MHRRLTALLTRLKVGGFAEYARLLENDPERRQEFRDYVTINVSEFFRDSDRFSDFERRVLPELLANSANVRVWSAGCSIGAEPYSLGILLSELGPGRTHRILATDIDQTIIDRAKAGTGYSAADIRNVATELTKRGFVAHPKGRYSVGSAVRGILRFASHHLLPAAP